MAGILIGILTTATAHIIGRIQVITGDILGIIHHILIIHITRTIRIIHTIRITRVILVLQAISTTVTMVPSIIAAVISALPHQREDQRQMSRNHPTPQGRQALRDLQILQGRLQARSILLLTRVVNHAQAQNMCVRTAVRDRAALRDRVIPQDRVTIHDQAAHIQHRAAAVALAAAEAVEVSAAAAEAAAQAAAVRAAAAEEDNTSLKYFKLQT